MGKNQNAEDCGYGYIKWDNDSSMYVNNLFDALLPRIFTALENVRITLKMI